MYADNPQRERAERIARELGAKNPSRSLVNALLALVEADEKYIPDAPPRWQRKPTPGAKQILKPPPAPKPPPEKPASKRQKKQTKPQEEPQLALF